MLSIFASNGSLVEEAALKKYLDYLVKDKKQMGIKTAGIVYDNGNVAAATSKFNVKEKDFKEIKKLYLRPEVTQISIGGVTYCLKSRSPRQLVCFNGRNYVVISKTELTFIIATCQARQNSDIVAEWLETVAKRLRERRK